MTVHNHRLADVHVTQAIANFNQEAERLIQGRGETPGETEAARLERQESNRIRLEPAVARVNSTFANPRHPFTGAVVGGELRVPALASLINSNAFLNRGDQPADRLAAMVYFNHFLAVHNF